MQTEIFSTLVRRCLRLLVLGLLVPALPACTTSRRVPLSDQALSSLAQKARTPKQAGFGLQEEESGNIRFENVRQFPLGVNVKAPIIPHPSLDSLIRVQINERPTLALLDSGSTHSLVSHDTAIRTSILPISAPPEFEGRKVQGLISMNAKGVDGQMEYFLALAYTMKIGNLNMYKIPFGVLNNQSGFWKGGNPVPGHVQTLIGSDLLVLFNYITFDYPKGTVTLGGSDKYRPNPARIAATVPLVMKSGFPTTPAMIDGQGPVTVVIDTGGHYGMRLPRATAQFLSASNPGPEEPGRTDGSLEPADTRTLSLGGYEIPRIQTRILPEALTFSESPVAFLGTEHLSRYAVTFDFKARKFYLENP